MNLQTFLKTYLKAYYDVFKNVERYTYYDTKILKGCIYVARDLVKEGYLSELPIAYGWHHYGVYSYGLHNLITTYKSPQFLGQFTDIDERLFRAIKRILSKKYYEIFLNSDRFNNYNHKGALNELKEENPETRTLLEKYYDLIDNKIKKSFDNIINSQSTLMSFGSNTKVLKEYMVELLELLPFEYRGEEREDAFWDYIDLLFVFLKGYEKHKNVEPIKELKELFEKNVLTIISPFPDTLTGPEDMRKVELERYDKKLNKSLEEVINKLETIREKYREYLPTFEELKEEIDVVPLNDKLKKELKAELRF